MIVTALALLAFPQIGEREPVEIPVLPQFYRPPTHQSTLSEVTVRVHLRAKIEGQPGAITFPVPSDYSGQSVIAFRVECEPASALKKWNWQTRKDGLNSIVRATVLPPHEGATVLYTARVLVPGFAVLRTQRKDFRNWLAATATVQSDDLDVRALSKTLAAPGGSRSDLAARVAKFVAQHKAQLNLEAHSFDAKSGLELGGNSLARANLCAAVLRSAQIPARVVSHFPTWAEGMEAQTWLTEYASEVGNWEMIEPTIGLQYPARNSVVVMSISSLIDENHVPANTSSPWPGAPALSTPELSPELIWLGDGERGLTSRIRLMKIFPGPSGARVMSSGFRQGPKVISLAKKGESTWFNESSFQKALAKGPINFALFLDGQPTMPGH